MSKIAWSLLLLLSFIITLPVSWWLLAKADFAYPYLYDVIGIDQHIARYAPKNTQGKKHFEQTSKEERLALFHGVVKAIHKQGKGLDKLAYKDRTSGQSIPLFTQAEITHLQDVSKLLDKLKVLLTFLTTLWLMIVVLLWRFKRQLPSAKQLLLSSIALLVLGAAILSLGPEAVFNQLHKWVFPDNHQWFFYYEESLMSTLMKAPDLFAYIAAIWLVLSIILTTLLIKLLNQLLSQTSRSE